MNTDQIIPRPPVEGRSLHARRAAVGIAGVGGGLLLSAINALQIIPGTRYGDLTIPGALMLLTIAMGLWAQLQLRKATGQSASASMPTRSGPTTGAPTAGATAPPADAVSAGASPTDTISADLHPTIRSNRERLLIWALWTVVLVGNPLALLQGRAAAGILMVFGLYLIWYGATEYWRQRPSHMATRAS